MKTFFYVQLEWNFRRKTHKRARRVRSHQTSRNSVFTCCYTFARSRPYRVLFTRRLCATHRGVRFEEIEKKNWYKIKMPYHRRRVADGSKRMSSVRDNGVRRGQRNPDRRVRHSASARTGWIFYPRKTLIFPTVGYYRLISNFRFA